MTNSNLSKINSEQSMPEFDWQVRVYYEDTDAAGVVYHSNYLKYMERARTEWLRSAGFTQTGLKEDNGVVFVVSSMKIDFIVPARFEEHLRIRSTIINFTGLKLRFRQSISSTDGVLKCEAEIDIVCTDAITLKPKRIPEDIKVKLINDR
jgi:acyl-CoA thioester hydrolase